MNKDKLVELAVSKGMKSDEAEALIEKAGQGGVDGLRAIRKLNAKLRNVPEVGSVFADALPREPIMNFAVNIANMERTQIAAALLWLSNDHLEEVQEFLRWFKLPVVDDYDSLKNLMKDWITKS